MLDSTIQYTLDGADSINYGLYESLENNTVYIAFSTVIYQNQKIRSAFIARLQLDITSSEILFSIMYRVIQTAKCHFKYILTRF